MSRLKRGLSRLSSAGPGSQVAVVSPTADESAAESETKVQLNQTAAPIAGGDPDISKSDRIAVLRGRLNRMAVAKRQKVKAPSKKSEVAELWGSERETTHGTAHIVEQRFSEAHCHGVQPLASALGVDAAHLLALSLDEAMSTVDTSRMVFFDTETTGLMGGAGTLAFLIGIGWFEGNEFKLQQFVLKRPNDEKPILAHVAERIGWASVLVSYNGKSFDWPLLRNRFVMNRITVPDIPPHLDLLHCSRRLFKRRMDGMRLTHVEEQVLGFERIDDIGGALIPERYFEFLRGADGGCLNPIIEHNQHDIVALAAILGRLVAHVRGEHDGDPRDLLCLAELHAKGRDFGTAAELALRAAELSNDDFLASEALLSAGLYLRRRQDFEGAVLAWQRCVALTHCDPLSIAQAHLALAKVYEHQFRNFSQAMRHAEAAQDADGDDNELRTARLERKLREQEHKKS